MAQIEPFKGIRYNTKKVDIAKVTAPPYDVISSSMQERLYKDDRYNVVRLVLGKEEKRDTPRNNKYSRAAKFLEKSLKDKILIQDTKPSIYVYFQKYLHKGKKRTRIGFIALMKIEDPKRSGILPHEYTLEKPKKDRLSLIKSTKANSSPIFSLFRDKENEVNKILKGFIESKNPLFTLEQEGVSHKLWKMSDKSAINKIKKNLKNKKIFIADGHHRYEVALSFSNMRQGSDYVMMYFSNLSEKGNLTILSTHRVVRNIGGDGAKEIISKLKKYFDARKENSVAAMIETIGNVPRNKYAFGAYVKNKLYLLTLKNTYSMNELIRSKKAYSLKKLDVTILHDLIINRLLGVKNPESNIKYIRNERDAITLVDKGDYEIAFFLRPTAISDVRRVAEKGVMMPQKSTYFYPKLLSGLVINKF